MPPSDAQAQQELFTAAMVGANAAPPDGIPSTWSWAQHAEVDNPSNPGWAAMTAWGQVYAAAGALEPPSGTVRVEVKDMRSYVWSRRARRWVMVQGTLAVDGRHYVDDFRANGSIAADLRTEPDGGTSATMVVGYNFHFWPTSGRAPVAPGDIAGVITEYQARLIGPGAAAGVYVANVGGDWWRNTSVPFDFTGPTGNNLQIGEGRFVELSQSWTTVAFYTGGP